MQQPQHRDIDAPPGALPVTFEPTDERTRAEMAALTDEELLVVNLDISVIVTQIVDALPELRGVEALVIRRWNEPPLGQIERLERYLRTVLVAHTRCQGLKAELPDVAGMVKELAGIRQHLWSCARPLALAGVVSHALPPDDSQILS